MTLEKKKKKKEKKKKKRKNFGSLMCAEWPSDPSGETTNHHSPFGVCAFPISPDFLFPNFFFLGPAVVMRLNLMPQPRLGHLQGEYGVP